MVSNINIRISLFFILSCCLISCVGEDYSSSYNSEKNTIFHWRLQSQFTKSEFEFHALQQLAEKIEIMTDGHLSITVYQKNLLGQGPDIFQRVSEGNIEIGMGQPEWWSHMDLGWTAIQAVPFGFMNIETSMMFFLQGKGTDLANQMSQQHGIIWRPASWSGMGFGLITTFPSRYLSDFKNKTILMKKSLGSELLENVSGVKTVQVPPTEIYNAIRNRTVHGVEWGTAYEAYYMKFHRLCNFAISPAFWQPSMISDFLINKKAYEKIPYTYQVALETALKAYSTDVTMEKRRQDIKAVESFYKFGTNISVWTTEDIRLLKRGADRIQAKYANQSYSFKRISDLKRQFKMQYTKHENLHSGRL